MQTFAEFLAGLGGRESALTIEVANLSTRLTFAENERNAFVAVGHTKSDGLIQEELVREVEPWATAWGAIRNDAEKALQEKRLELYAVQAWRRHFKV